MGWSKQKIRAFLSRKSLNLSRCRTGNWRALFFCHKRMRQSMSAESLESMARFLTGLPHQQIRHVIERCYLNWTRTRQTFCLRSKNRGVKARNWRVKTIFKNEETVSTKSSLSESGIESSGFSDSLPSSEWDKLSSFSVQANFSPAESRKLEVKCENIKTSFEPNPSKYAGAIADIKDLSSTIENYEDCYLFFEKSSSSVENSTFHCVEKAAVKKEMSVAEEKKIATIEKEAAIEEKEAAIEEKEAAIEEKEVGIEGKNAKEEKSKNAEEEKTVTKEQKRLVKEEKEACNEVKNAKAEKTVANEGKKIAKEEKAGNERKVTKVEKQVVKETKKVANKVKMNVKEEKVANEGKVTKEEKTVANEGKNAEEEKKVSNEKENAKEETEAAKKGKAVRGDLKTPDCTGSACAMPELVMSPLILAIMKNSADVVDKTTKTGKMTCLDDIVENIGESKESTSTMDEESHNEGLKTGLEEQEKAGGCKLPSTVTDLCPRSPVEGIDEDGNSEDKMSPTGQDTPVLLTSPDSSHSSSSSSSVTRDISFLLDSPPSSPHFIYSHSSVKRFEGVKWGKNEERSDDKKSSKKRNLFRLNPAPPRPLTSFSFTKNINPIGIVPTLNKTSVKGIFKFAESPENVVEEILEKSFSEAVGATNGNIDTTLDEGNIIKENCEVNLLSSPEISIVKEVVVLSEPVMNGPTVKELPEKESDSQKMATKTAEKNSVDQEKKLNKFATSTPSLKTPDRAKIFVKNNPIFSTGTQTDITKEPSPPAVDEDSRPLKIDAAVQSKQERKKRKIRCHCRKTNLKVRLLHRKVIGLKKLLLYRTRSYRADKDALISLVKDHTKIMKDVNNVMEDNSNVMRSVMRVLESHPSRKKSSAAQPAPKSGPPHSPGVTPASDSEKVSPDSPDVERICPEIEATSLRSVTKRLFEEGDDAPTTKELKRKAKKRLSLSQSKRAEQKTVDVVTGWDVIRQKAADLGKKRCLSPIVESSIDSSEPKDSSQELFNRSPENSLTVDSSSLSIVNNMGSAVEGLLFEKEQRTEKETVEELKKCLQELEADEQDEELQVLPKKRKHIRFQMDEEDDIPAGASAAQESSPTLRQSQDHKKELKNSSQPDDLRNREKAKSTKNKSVCSDEDTSWEQYIRDLVGRLEKEHSLNDSRSSQETSDSINSDKTEFKKEEFWSKLEFRNEDILSYLFLDEQFEFKTRKTDPNFKEFPYDDIALKKILSDLKVNGDLDAAEKAVYTCRPLDSFDRERAEMGRQLRQYLKIFSPSAPFSFYADLDMQTGKETIRIFASEARCCGERVEFLEGIKVHVKSPYRGNLLHFVNNNAKKEENKFRVLVGPASFTSHWCSPNAKVVSIDRHTVGIVVTRDVLPGDEFVIAEGSDVCCTHPKGTINPKQRFDEKTKPMEKLIKF